MTEARGLMAGKRGLIMGVANERSIAWGIAKTAAAHGAELAFTYQGELQSGSIPYTGSADIQFRAFTTASGVVTIGPEITLSDIDCNAGRFTATLDFLQELPAGSHL